MRKLLLALLLLVPSVASAQSVKGPLTVNFFFTPTDVANTDYYEVCNSPAATNCVQVTTTTVLTELQFTKVFNDGPYTLAVRACNAAACSTLSNSVNIPKVVITGPNKPNNLRIVIVPTP